jgi:hypothetical protein
VSSVSLPNRQSLRSGPALPTPTPGARHEQGSASQQPSERASPVLVALIAVAACAIGWAVATFLF